MCLPTIALFLSPTLAVKNEIKDVKDSDATNVVQTNVAIVQDIEITDIVGISGVTIRNNGNMVLNNIGWSIDLEALTFKEGYIDGNIPHFEVGGVKKIYSKFVFGIRPRWFRVEVGDTDKAQNCYLLGTIVLLRSDP